MFGEPQAMLARGPYDVANLGRLFGLSASNVRGTGLSAVDMCHPCVDCWLAYAFTVELHPFAYE